MKENLYLPLELWREILRRLPVISIIRYQCVCKSWYDLIQGKWGEFTLSYTPKLGLAFVQDQGTGYAVYDEAFQTLFRFSLPPPHNQYPSFAHPRAVIDTVNVLILVWNGFTIMVLIFSYSIQLLVNILSFPLGLNVGAYLGLE